MLKEKRIQKGLIWLIMKYSGVLVSFYWEEPFDNLTGRWLFWKCQSCLESKSWTLKKVETLKHVCLLLPQNMTIRWNLPVDYIYLLHKYFKLSNFCFSLQNSMMTHVLRKWDAVGSNLEMPSFQYEEIFKSMWT